MADKTNPVRAQDRILYCENCGISFLWAKEEQPPSHRMPEAGSQGTQGHDRPDADTVGADKIGADAVEADAAGKAPAVLRRRSAQATQPHLCPGCRVILPPDGIERGLVKWFNRRRRYGFVIRRDADEIFAHGSDIVGRQSMRPGDLVEFRVEQGDRGPMAKEIRIVDHTDESIAD